eukprot:CAMPEP_0176475834 /NCGR_PEP_ID=MMETSP0127-20121128/43818_1 /TAXON_ID=938130 /ORGANISM="Platyophrya macrostoma, Strain WH" /LENGTH=452 /DNA_ID=CAMNT_0017871457 /DNA_START=1 /DNA_END=1359 /DNA_ORIENTATION=-
MDQSFQVMPSMNPKISSTLEKIRHIEEKKRTPQREIREPLTERYVQKQRNDFLGPLKEKLADFAKKTSNTQYLSQDMEVEAPKRYETSKKAMMLSEKENYRSPYEERTEQTRYTQPTQPSTTKKEKDGMGQLFNIATSGMHPNQEIDEDFRRMYDEDRTHRRQKTDSDSYRKVENKRKESENTRKETSAHKRKESENRNRDSEHRNRESEHKRKEAEKMHEIYEQRYDENDYNTGYSARAEHVVERSAEPKQKKKSNESKTHKSSSSKSKTRETKDDSAVQKSAKQNVSEFTTSQTQPISGSFLDGWIQHGRKQAERSTERGRSPDNERSPKERRKKSKNEDGDSGAKKVRVKGLHDWINRRVTGYLIYQNTIHDEGGLEKDHAGDHLNRVAGEKWKSMSQDEKNEYKEIALRARKFLKKDVRDVDIDDPNIKDLQEVLEKKIKKVKKDRFE